MWEDLPPMDEPARYWKRLNRLDWLPLGMLVGGVLCVATGLLCPSDAASTLGHILPLLMLFGTVLVLAELAAIADVFDVVAARLAITARGSHVTLFALWLGSPRSRP
jgi:arsenical pump membrane protein